MAFLMVYVCEIMRLYDVSPLPDKGFMCGVQKKIMSKREKIKCMWLFSKNTVITTVQINNGGCCVLGRFG